MIILADDLSGAAEVAGIVHSHGQEAVVCFESGVGAEKDTGAAVQVVDTESRQLGTDAAAAAVSRACRGLGRSADVFKKTDSVLRGQVRAEIEAAMQSIGVPRCILVPCNPSRGRTIHQGLYRVGGVPLSETEFGSDPTHPATTSEVRGLLGPGVLPLAVSAPGATPAAEGITVGEARDAADVAAWASRLDRDTLAAGAADFLSAILVSRGYPLIEPKAVSLPSGPRLLVSGSRSAASRETLEALERSGVPVFRIGGTRPLPRLTVAPRIVVLAIHGDADAQPAARLDDLCAAAEAVYATMLPAILLAEGGATAAALARRIGWTRFRVRGVLAPGVVVLQPEAAPGILFVIKPGSYPWPASLV